jgi:hypothetical protein
VRTVDISQLGKSFLNYRGIYMGPSENGSVLLATEWMMIMCSTCLRFDQSGPFMHSKLFSIYFTPFLPLLVPSCKELLNLTLFNTSPIAVWV